MAKLHAEQGHIYRAKKQRPGFYCDDRQVLRAWTANIQYDGPYIRDGRKYPTITREAFEQWIGTDVTEGYPAGDWAVRNG